MFIDANYSWRGAIKLNRLAWGVDIVVTPFNFIVGIPNFILRVLAVTLEFLGARTLAQGLFRCHLGLSTSVQKTLTAKLKTDLLGLQCDPEDASDRQRHLVELAAREPVKIYVRTRNVAGDITAGILAVLIGIVFFNQFTPGSMSAGSAMAHIVAKEQAVSDFALGDVLGQLYYAMFPVDPSLTIIIMVVLVVTAIIALVGAFSGIIHDPIQTITGIHQRRLNQMLNAIEASFNQTAGKGYRPKDTFFGRILDLVDWVKGLLAF